MIMKKDYCENCNTILGFECTYVLPKNSNSKGILTIEHWDGNPNNDLADNIITLCGNCAMYKTNLYQDWTTPGRNLKKVEGRSWVEPVDFIYKDWIAYCRQPSFQKVRNNIGIIVGKTGQGKTYSISKYMIPEWSKSPHDIDLIIVTAPQKGIIDDIDFAIAGQKNGYYHTTDAQQALSYVQDGLRVILTTNHVAFINANCLDLLIYVQGQHIKHAIVIDEAHTWLCTGSAAYRRVMGWGGAKYNASLYNLLSNISTYNPYIFGLTATPNGEQTGKVQIDSSDTTFEIINKNCPVELLLTKQAWWDEFVPLDILDQQTVFNQIEKRIIQVENEKLETGVKKAIFIQCNQDRDYNDVGLDINSILNEVNRIYRELGHEGQFKTCRMTSGRNEIYSPEGGRQENLDETKLKRMLNDNDDPLTIILVVNKGGMGMNLPPLGGMIFTKRTDKDDGEGESLTEFARQYMGRLVRPNVTNPKELKQKFDYDFSKYYQSLSTDKERRNAIKANSFFVDYPDNNEMWKTAIEEFKESYCNSVEFATESLEKM